ncbi:MAG: ATP-binding protein [Defluviitaleaceae bacterium]|nr:ATP-binding protein [Defluviitaleaceae bacterium]MCL2273375.1 ATP-binding protein [Defluviitaleaceae bacterium]
MKNEYTDLHKANQHINQLEQKLEALQAACDAAEAANKAKTIFLANMSHEIRTPMNSILGFSELALDYNIQAKAREYIHNIRESANWLLNIINDLLDISKIESGSVELESVPFNLSDLFFHCQAGLIHRANDKGVSLICNAEKIPSKFMLGDSARLRQIFTNLLSNAVKFTASGSVSMLANLKGIENNRATFYFEVKDTGMGMTDEQMERIFEPFMQADNSISRKFGGTGLGLTITKNIVNVMGGDLIVTSKIGVGTTFSFSLTFDLIDEASAIAILTQNDIIEKPNFNGEILVCEDNELNQIVICENLAKVGLTTIVANNGKEAVQIIEERIKDGDKPFDLIFMDIYLPIMDGMEAAKYITKLGITTPIVALTASAIRKMPEEYTQSGMRSFVCKPFTTQELWTCLVKYLPVLSYSTIAKDQQSAEEQKMLKHLRLNFVKDNQNTFKTIEEALNSNDIKLAHRMAHTIKSNAGQIHETKLQETAAALEEKLEGGNNLLQKGMLTRFRLDLSHVLDKLAPLLDEANEDVFTLLDDPQEIQALLDKLEPLIANKNPDCEDMIPEIRTIPDSEILVKMIENFKFRQAAQELVNIKKRWGIS